MAKKLQLRRGTAAQHDDNAGFTGAAGEVTVDTTTNTLRVHNNSTKGGIKLALASDVPTLIDEDNMASNDATKAPSQQSVKAYVDAGDLSLIDEDNMSTNSATRPPSQQSTKAYVDTTVGAHLLDEDNFATNSATKPPSQQSVKAYVDTADALKANLAGPTFTGVPAAPTAAADTNTTQIATTAYVQTELGDFAPKAAPAFTGTATGVNLTLSGNLTVNGTTTTVASTNTTISDNLLELNSGASSNANDSGILIERGSTGDNAIIAWDESADKFTVGTPTGTASSSGDITITTGTLVANVEGNGSALTHLNLGEANSTGTVPVARLGSGTASTSTFLRGDNSWQTVSGTTINNNADNRLITGSGTANTLEGEANLTYDGTDLTCGGKVKDSKGDVRVAPVVELSGAYNQTAADIGKTILTQGANNITLTSTNMVAGAMVTIVNTHSSDITVEDGSVYLRIGGDSAIKTSVSLASYAVATVLWLSADTASICGTGVS